MAGELARAAGCVREPGGGEIVSESLSYLFLQRPGAGEFRVPETLTSCGTKDKLSSPRASPDLVLVASSCSKLFYKRKHLRTARAKCSHRCKVE